MAPLNIDDVCGNRLAKPKLIDWISWNLLHGDVVSGATDPQQNFAVSMDHPRPFKFIEHRPSPSKYGEGRFLLNLYLQYTLMLARSVV